MKEAGGKNKIGLMRQLLMVIMILMIIDPTDTVVMMMIMIGINTATTSIKTSMMITIHSHCNDPRLYRQVLLRHCEEV